MSHVAESAVNGKPGIVHSSYNQVSSDWSHFCVYTIHYTLADYPCELYTTKKDLQKFKQRELTVQEVTTGYGYI